MHHHALRHRYGHSTDYRLGKWYTQFFSDLELYFFPTAVQVNGGLAGIMVRVDLTRSRAKPRAVKQSVPSMNLPPRPGALWKEVPLEAVPEKVQAAAAERR
jgi:hypothetical protein